MSSVSVRKIVIYVLSALVVVSVVSRGVHHLRAPDVKEAAQKDTLFGLIGEPGRIEKKLDDLAENVLAKQENRLEKLERENQRLEKQLVEMKKPSANLSVPEKLSFMYSYDVNSKFPAYIWQSWRYGLNDDRFGKELKEGEEQWSYLNPGFVHDFFNDETSIAVIRYLYMNIPEVVQAYTILPHLALKADFFKYLILFAKGGVYADVDTLPLQPIPNWIPENVNPNELGMIIGIESDTSRRDEWKKHYTRKLQFGNWIIQAKPGHPILREIIADITETTLRKSKEGGLLIRSDQDPEFALDVMGWTGTGRFTDVILSYFNNYMLSGIFSQITWKEFTRMEVPKLVSDVLVLPANSFNADANDKMPKNVVSSDRDHPLAFVVHYRNALYATEWVDN